MSARNHQLCSKIGRDVRAVLADVGGNDSYRRHLLCDAVERFTDLRGSPNGMVNDIKRQTDDAGLPDWVFLPSEGFNAMYWERRGSRWDLTYGSRIFERSFGGARQTFDISTPSLFAQAMLATVQEALSMDGMLNRRQAPLATDILVAASEVLTADDESSGWDSDVLPLGQGRAAYEFTSRELTLCEEFQFRLGQLSKARFRPFTGPVKRPEVVVEEGGSSPRP